MEGVPHSSDFGPELAEKWPDGGKLKARKYSSDVQDSKKLWVGHLPGTLWGSAGPKLKIANRCIGQKMLLEAAILCDFNDFWHSRKPL